MGDALRLPVSRINTNIRLAEYDIKIGSEEFQQDAEIRIRHREIEKCTCVARK